MCYRNPVQPNYSWTENYFDKREVSLKPGWQFNRFFDRLNHGLNHLISVTDALGDDLGHDLQPADIGWPTGNGKKLSCSQAQLGQATCLAIA